MVDTSGKHWYGSGDIENIYLMLERFDQANLGLYTDSYLSQSLGDGLAPEDEPEQNFRLDKCSAEEALEEGIAFSNRDFGAGEFGNKILKNVKAAFYAHARGLAATTPMEEYVSPDPEFNSLLKGYPGVVVIADVLDHLEWLGMDLKLKPSGGLEPLTALQMAGLIPGMWEDFAEYYGRSGANMLDSRVYAWLDDNGKNIYWVKPAVERNKRISSVNHYLYSPQRKSLRVLDFIDLFIGLEGVVPASKNLRDSYLGKADEWAIPEWSLK